MTGTPILVVDDEPRIRRVLELALSDLGYRVVLADDLAAARTRLAAERVQLVLADLQLPDGTGLDLLEDIREERDDLPVILMTAYGTVETAVQAMKLGAFDYVVKPFSVDEIDALVRRALGFKRAEREIAYLREIAAPDFEGMVAASPAMQDVVDAIERVAPTPSTVLVTGETGVGKELVARAIHARSPRADSLFVALNCAAIPGELLEAELFGVMKGAYTGATEDRPGKFELADGGTLFLDEIGDMPGAMQAKLLRTLQEGTVERLGSNVLRRVDVRIVAATHRDLPGMVEDGDFRADLYYRLNVFPIHVAPLRDRPADVAPLALRAVERFGSRGGRTIRLDEGALRRLEAYAWPGNVRELNNVLERAVILSSGDVVHAEDLALLPPGRGRPTGAGGAPGDVAPGRVETLESAVERAERQAIRAALTATEDNKTKAAELLGVSVRTLWYKLDRLGMREA